MNSRRLFIYRMGAIISSLLGIAACQDHGENNRSSTISDPTFIDRKTLDAVVDAFVPKDQDAGAVEAGASEKLLELFEKSEDMRNHGTVLLARVEVVAQHKYRKPFYQLSLAKREEIIHKTLYSPRKDDQSASLAINILSGHVIRAFYLSPVGQSILGYTPPYPNGYPDYHTPL